MAIVYVQSPDDGLLEPYRNLKSTNATRDRRLFVAEGDKLVDRLLASRIELQSLLVAQSYLQRFEHFAASSVPIFVIPDDWVDDLVGYNFHRGILACGYRPKSADLAALCARPGRLLLLACPAVQDPENLGAILRIAAAFGIDGLLLGKDCCDPFSRRVLRVSMGTALQMPLVIADDLCQGLSRAAEQNGIQLWAAVADGRARSLPQAGRPERLAVVLGSEGHGLDDQWLAACHEQVTIPIESNVDSLNVAVASGILLYCLTRS